MAGLLGDIYSYGDTLKRKVKGLLADPVGTVSQMAGQFNDDMNTQISNMRTGYGFDGGKSVLASPEQQAGARRSLADYGAQNGLAGMFIGNGAKTWDAISAKKAEEMAAQGVDPRKVWSETGTWKGPDGMWRQEIPDNKATIGSRVQQDKTIADISGRAMFDKKGGYAQLGDVLNHDELYKAYPVSQDMAISFDGQLGGAYSKDTMGRGGMGSMQFGYESKGTSTPMHEIQHAIQQREGWAKGGSPENFDQQDIAVTARDMLNWQKEVKARLQDNPALDWKSAEAMAAKEYQSLGWPEAVPSPEIRKMAQNPLEYFESQPEEFVKLYGLDRRTTPYTQNEAYRRLAGEAEARATQARIPLDAAQRRALFPEDSYDVPMNQLIIRGLLADK